MTKTHSDSIARPQTHRLPACGICGSTLVVRYISASQDSPAETALECPTCVYQNEIADELVYTDISDDDRPDYDDLTAEIDHRDILIAEAESLADSAKETHERLYKRQRRLISHSYHLQDKSIDAQYKSELEALEREIQSLYEPIKRAYQTWYYLDIRAKSLRDQYRPRQALR